MDGGRPGGAGLLAWRVGYEGELLRIREIRFEGLARTTAAELLELSPAQRGDHLLLCDTDLVAAGLRRHPWVAGVARLWSEHTGLAVECVGINLPGFGLSTGPANLDRMAPAGLAAASRLLPFPHPAVRYVVDPGRESPAGRDLSEHHRRQTYLPCVGQRCGRNSVVECSLPKADVVGSNPIARS